MNKNINPTLNKAENGNKSKPLLGNVYNILLNNFVSFEGNRNWMTRPFSINEIAISTNDKCLIFFNKNLVSEIDELQEDKKENVLSKIPTDRNENFEIKLLDLEKSFKDINLGGFLKCDACNGSGTVEYEFRHNVMDYKEKHECPVCEGFGQIENLVDCFIDIKKCRFSVKLINYLIFTANKLQSETIELVYQIRPNAANVFKIKDVEILIMPAFIDSDNDVILNLA